MPNDEIETSSLISVIVPIYKVEDYLRKCVDSILNQTYQNLEIILVDDGSPDHCGKICDEYAIIDSRVRVIHKKNNGVSSARNAGINVAQGEYILFCDSDDTVENNWVQWFADQVKEESVILAVCGASFVMEKSVELIGVGRTETLVTADVVNIINSGAFCCVWNKIFKKSLIQSNGITFDESISYGEDTLFVINYLKSCNNTGKIRFKSDSLYKYNIEATNSLSKKVSGFWNIEEGILIRLSELLKYFGVKDDTRDQTLADRAGNQMCMAISDIIKRKSGVWDKYKAVRELLKNKWCIMSFEKSKFQFCSRRFSTILKTKSPFLIMLYMLLSEQKRKYE